MKYKIFSTHTRPRYFIVEEVGGSVSLDDVIDAIMETDDWEEWMSEDIFYIDDIYHTYGPTTLINKVLKIEGDDEQGCIDKYFCSCLAGVSGKSRTSKSVRSNCCRTLRSASDPPLFLSFSTSLKKQ